MTRVAKDASGFTRLCPEGTALWAGTVLATEAKSHGATETQRTQRKEAETWGQQEKLQQRRGTEKKRQQKREHGVGKRVWAGSPDESGRGGFTLMELLAAVTLMVILGTMLFSVFKSSSGVVSDATGRQLVFQQAKLFMDHMEQELSGVHWVRESPTLAFAQRLRPFQIPANGKAIALTTACKVRDTRYNSKTFGIETNLGRIGYFLGDGAITLADGTVTDRHTLYRYEYYTLYGSGDDPATVQAYATPFIVNVVSFSVECNYVDTVTKTLLGFSVMQAGWDSNNIIAGVPPLPKAVRITLRLTDDRHLKEYDNISGNDTNDDGVVDKNEADDQIGQTFEYVGYLGSRVW